MPTVQQSDLTAELYGGPRENPIGRTDAEIVRAARAAVEASFETPEETAKEVVNAGHRELFVDPDLYGGARPNVFTTVSFEDRFANLQAGIRMLAGAGIASM